MIGDSKFIATIFKVRARNISTLFFSTTSSESIETTVKRYRFDQRTPAFDLSGRLIAVAGEDEKESDTMSRTSEDGAVDDYVSVTGRPQYIIKKALRSLEDAGTITMTTTAPIPPVVTKPSPPDEDADIEDTIGELFDMSTEGKFDPAEHDLLPDKTDEDLASLPAVLGVIHTQEVKVNREKPMETGRMGSDGFQVTNQVVIPEDVYYSDLTEAEIEDVLHSAEAMPFQDAIEYKYDPINLNATAARLVGILAGKAAMQRGTAGGGYLVYRPRDMYGGMNTPGEIEGHKWMRIPITVWTMVVENDTNYRNLMIASLQEHIRPPSGDSPGKRMMVSLNSLLTTDTPASAMMGAVSTHSSDISALVNRQFQITNRGIDIGQPTVRAVRQVFVIASVPPQVVEKKGDGKG
jgi:hypothetical protein